MLPPRPLLSFIVNLRFPLPVGLPSLFIAGVSSAGWRAPTLPATAYIPDAHLANLARLAPIVASAFSPALAPVGVLMAVLGYALGTYGALICAWMMQAVVS